MTSDKTLFSTKARTLQAFRDVLTSAQILPIIIVTYEQWLNQREETLAWLTATIDNFPIIVRSSSHNEDQQQQSLAGKYKSVLNVHLIGLANAITSVFDSFDSVNSDDEVLIQPMLKNILRSGVAFTHDPNTCSPYRVINWTDGADTTAVTGGQGGRVWHGAAGSPVSPPECLVQVLTLVEELLALADGTPLDCEFAVTESSLNREQLWLLQVRPLLMQATPITDGQLSERLNSIHRNLVKRIGQHPFLLGKRTVYGIMPDWNPAEIIGVRPRPLALSLYRDLVTDSIWAYQRNNYGYRNLRSFPLLVHFLGLPYIDVRVSFNSFIPQQLNEHIATKLVDYYISKLIDNPQLHDKIEFDIAFTGYHLSLPSQLQELLHHNFTKTELKEVQKHLRELTKRILDPTFGLLQRDIQKIELLMQRRQSLLDSGTDVLTRIYWLLEDTKRYGTLPFAGLARAGFIAIQFLRSLVSTGLIEAKQYDEFMSGLSTVSGQLANDWGTLDQQSFLAKYGHLRPGTYDIMKPRYDEQPDMYFDWSRTRTQKQNQHTLSLSLSQIKEISKALRQHKINIDFVTLFDFLQEAIEWRERSKFEFSKNVSDVLELLVELGASIGFTREDMSYVDIRAIQELYVGPADLKEVVEKSIVAGRERYAQTLHTTLPPLIVNANDIWAFETPAAFPNFVTQLRTKGKVVSASDRANLVGAIVCIPSADPGYDWLFGYSIAGLVTEWGGANSHMAIRAGELGIPAIIGAGQVLYKLWSTASALEIDCAARLVTVFNGASAQQAEWTFK